MNDHARESTRRLWVDRHGPVLTKAERSRRLNAFDAEIPVRRHMPVADALLEFDVWEDGNRWWAAASGPEYSLSLEARNVDPAQLRLVTLTDIEPYIAGRNEWIRQQRGER